MDAGTGEVRQQEVETAPKSTPVVAPGVEHEPRNLKIAVSIVAILGGLLGFISFGLSQYQRHSHGPCPNRWATEECYKAGLASIMASDFEEARFNLYRSCPISNPNAVSTNGCYEMAALVSDDPVRYKLYLQLACPDTGAAARVACDELRELQTRESKATAAVSAPDPGTTPAPAAARALEGNSHPK